MWDKLQTHGDRRNDAEVLAIAAAGAPLDIMAMFFESHIEELVSVEDEREAGFSLSDVPLDDLLAEIKSRTEG